MDDNSTVTVVGSSVEATVSKSSALIYVSITNLWDKVFDEVDVKVSDVIMMDVEYETYRLLQDKIQRDIYYQVSSVLEEELLKVCSEQDL